MTENPRRHILKDAFSKPRLLKETRGKYIELFGKKHNSWFVKYQLKDYGNDSLEALNEVILPFLISSKSFLQTDTIKKLFSGFDQKLSVTITDLTLDFIHNIFVLI